jgi:conjugal transfer/entry exclusion protein
MAFVSYVAGLPIWVKCDLRAQEGTGDKSLLRSAARMVGMGPISDFKKRAMQFGEYLSALQVRQLCQMRALTPMLP